MRYTNINGHLKDSRDAVLPADNTAFRYGGGLFETMLVRDGGIRLESYHQERLFSSMALLGWHIPALFTWEMLSAQVQRTVKRNGLEKLCRVRLQVYGGGGGIFGPETDELHYVIACYTLQDTDVLLNVNGLQVGIIDELRKSADMLANLKSSNALLYTVAGRTAKKQRWNDALIQNTEGNIIESVIANIFWIKDGEVYTPPLSEGCIAGVMRRHLLQQLPEIRERPLTQELLSSADEVFLTNAIKGIRWVAAINEVTYTTRMVAELYTSLQK